MMLEKLSWNIACSGGRVLQLIKNNCQCRGAKQNCLFRINLTLNFILVTPSAGLENVLLVCYCEWELNNLICHLGVQDTTVGGISSLLPLGFIVWNCSGFRPWLRNWIQFPHTDIHSAIADLRLRGGILQKYYLLIEDLENTNTNKNLLKSNKIGFIRDADIKHKLNTEMRAKLSKLNFPKKNILKSNSLI